MEDRNEVTQRILNLTLEILYLLTGEDYIIVRKPGGRTANSNRLQVVEGFSRKQNSMSGPPPRSSPSERSEEKILELTTKMMELLTGEVPIRCQDVSVYFSMEEWEYLEGHRDLYKDVVMETSSPDGSRKRCPRPLYSRDPAQEDHEIPQTRPLYSRDPTQEHHEIPQTRPLYSRDPTQEHHEIPQTRPLYSRDLYKDVMMEDHQSRLSPGDCPSRHASGEICFPEVASDSEPEDSMIIDGGPEGLDTGEGYRRPEGLDACEGYRRPEGLDACERYRRPEGMDAFKADTGTEDIDVCEGDLGPEGLDACAGYRRPEGLDACEGDLGPDAIDTCKRDAGTKGIDAFRGHTPTSSVEGYQIRIKEEPLSDEEDGLAEDNLSRPIPYTCVRIKEEPQEEPPMFEEVIVPGDDTFPDQSPPVFGHIKVETVPAEEDDCSTPRDQGQSSPAHIKEEPVTFLNVLDVSRTHVQPTNPIPETLTYEVEIPVAKAPVKGPDNASLYSVRQKEDSMEILYHCPSCYQGFSSNLDLARHQVMHTVNKLFICSLCRKSFTEMSFLVKHQVIHTDLKLCVCPVCGGCFYSETSLAKHQKTHSLPLFCSTCGKCFFNKTELAIHERKHSGERPFGCHVCGKHFIAKSVLNKHMLIHTSMDLRK